MAPYWSHNLLTNCKLVHNALPNTLSGGNLRMNQFILRAAQLLDGTGAPAAGPAAVVVNRGKIEHVALGRQMDDLPDGIPVIDAGDRTVLPGLIDAHVHLCFNAAADHAAVRSEIEGQTDVRIALRAASNAATALAAGITTVRDCGGTGTVVQQLRNAIAAGILPGPHILACGSPITTTAGHLYFCGMIADNLDEVR